jgi:GWxTD domain-containing protein
MSKGLLYCFVAVVSLCVASCVNPLTDKEIARRYVHQADSIAALNNSVAARDRYKLALSYDETSTQAYSGLGKLSVAEKSWSSALNYFGSILKHDRNNFEAHYQRACCYRDRGRENYYIEKILSLIVRTDFDKAREEFQWIFSRDSLYSDVLYQYALLCCYDHEYPAAVSAALRQIELKPELREGPLGLFKIYREYIVTAGGTALSERLAQPKSDYDRFFRAEWQRRKGMTEEAEKEFSALLQRPGIVPKQLILQALARVAAKQDRDSVVERSIGEAINGIKSLAEADIVFEDIKYIVTDDEYRQYRTLTSADETVGFFKTFWGRRNPNPTRETNTRIATHYRRLVYAEENFQCYGPKTFAKNAGDTWLLNFPEVYYLNEEFNDKGIIYIRHGAPAQTVETPSSGGERNESWLYPATENSPEVLFDFHVSPEARAAEWRLVPVFSNPALWEDRAALSDKYAKLLSSDLSTFLQTRLMQATEEGKTKVATGLTTDRPAPSKELTYDGSLSVSCFRGDSGKTLVDMGYVISPMDASGGASEVNQAVNFDAEFSLHNSLWQKAAGGEKSRSYPQLRDRGKSVIESFHAVVPPDSYTVSWQAKARGANTLIRKNIHTYVPDFSVSSLTMSDVEVAYAIQASEEGSEFNKGALMVVPNPIRRCPQDRPLFLYFEIYNLPKDQHAKTSYTIEYRLTAVESQSSFFERLLGFGKKSSIAIHSAREGTQDWAAEHIALDVSDLEPGKYELEVTATDNLTKASVSRKQEVQIYKSM